MDGAGGVETSRVEVGPFEKEPVELGVLLSEHFRADVDGVEIRRRCSAWLTARLQQSGVALGAADHAVVHVIATEGWSLAQIVAGWVARADTPER